MECSFGLEQQDASKSVAALIESETRNNQFLDRTKNNKNSSNKTSDKTRTNKTRRGKGKKNKQKNERKNIDFSIIGSNANGLLGKQESLKNNINFFKPSIVTVQETKLKKLGSIRLKGYQIFEKLRAGGLGGGLLTAVDEDLEPVLISNEKDEEKEILTIQVKAGKHNIRVINAYGPQEDDPNEKVFDFWENIESQRVSTSSN